MRKLLLLFFLSIFSIPVLSQSIITGIIIDSETGESLPGASVFIPSLGKGTMTDLSGKYELSNISPGSYKIVASFVSYDKIESDITINSDDIVPLDFKMSQSTIGIDEVNVFARANRENENVLMINRKESNFSIESIGSDELSRKGLSNIESGVTNIVGITSMGPQQIFVRGLGDRYNNAVLNEMPIPSGNPNRKVIDLSIIPSKVVQSINVKKSFISSSYADFCGATIDIKTKEFINNNFFSIDFGFNYNTLSIGNRMKFESGFGGFRSLIGFNNSQYNLPSEIGTIGTSDIDFSTLIYDPFDTDFSYTSSDILPAFKLGITGGTKIGDFRVLYSGGFENEYDYSYGSKILPEAGGDIIYDFNFKKWSYNANTSGLTSIDFRNLNLDILFINNTSSSIEENEGYHSTNDGIIKARRYEYLNNRVFNTILGGDHFSDKRFNLDWKLSYSYVTNNTPDRRDLTWNYDEDTDLYYLRRENIANYRTYMKMIEHDFSSKVDLTYNLNKGNITSGLQYRLKTRDFISRDFFYETRFLDGIHDPENPSSYLTDEAFENGTLSLSEGTSLSNYYLVYQYIYSGYVNFNYNLTSNLILDLGFRCEYDDQYLYYRKSPERTFFTDPWIILNTSSPGFFPALNLKYSLDEKSNFKLSSSRTISRPLFTELGPFVNRGMYGEHNTFGNPELISSFNYNADLKYEYFPNPGDLYSFTLYGKYIDNPIEKYYKASSSKLISWMNTDNAKVGGFEIETRKKINEISLGFNFAYLYSQIDLGDNIGSNTNSIRPLQGASPYLFNADITYPISFNNDDKLYMTLVYNTFGKRIYAVGTDGKEDIYENPIHTLNLLLNYKISNKFSIKSGVKNLLNQTIKHTLKIDDGEMIINEYNTGIVFNISMSYNF